MTDQPTPEIEPDDTCRPVEVDGEIIRVRGAREMTDKERGYLAEVIQAAKRKYEAEHPEPSDPAQTTCIHPDGYEGECPCPPSCGCCQVAARTTPDDTALREQYAALAFNAVAPALKAHDHWLPLTVRQAVAAAVLAVRDREHAALKRAHVALAAQAGRDQAAVDRVGAECDRIEAAVRANPQDPDFDGAYLAAIGHIRAALQPPAPDGGPTVAEAAAEAHWTAKYAGEPQ